MKIEEVLHALGCESIVATKARFLEDCDFYLEALQEALNDPGFGLLREQLMRKETAAAFDTAHMLKGMIANFGITPLYNQIVQIVELVRSGAPDFRQLEEPLSELMRQRDLAQGILLKFI